MVLTGSVLLYWSASAAGLPNRNHLPWIRVHVSTLICLLGNGFTAQQITAQANGIGDVDGTIQCDITLLPCRLCRSSVVDVVVSLSPTEDEAIVVSVVVSSDDSVAEVSVEVVVASVVVETVVSVVVSVEVVVVSIAVVVVSVVVVTSVVVAGVGVGVVPFR